MTKPTVGRIVLVYIDPEDNNGADVAPAIITQVFDDKINVRVLTESDRNGVPWKTSVTLSDTRPDGDARHCAWWPPREDQSAPAVEPDSTTLAGGDGRKTGTKR